MTLLINFLYELTVKLILEVFGASGAIWGFTEVLKLRNSNTQEFWRYIALTIGILFFIRFIFSVKKLHHEIYVNN